jgi:hypothetical protein
MTPSSTSQLGRLCTEPQRATGTLRGPSGCRTSDYLLIGLPSPRKESVLKQLSTKSHCCLIKEKVYFDNLLLNITRVMHYGTPSPWHQDMIFVYGFCLFTFLKKQWELFPPQIPQVVISHRRKSRCIQYSDWMTLVASIIWLDNVKQT